MGKVLKFGAVFGEFSRLAMSTGENLTSSKLIVMHVQPYLGICQMEGGDILSKRLKE